jgi:hypothetical protein
MFDLEKYRPNIFLMVEHAQVPNPNTQKGRLTFAQCGQEQTKVRSNDYLLLAIVALP